VESIWSAFVSGQLLSVTGIRANQDFRHASGGNAFRPPLLAHPAKARKIFLKSSESFLGGSARHTGRYIAIAGPRAHAFAHIFRTAGLPVHQPQPKSLRLALFKRSTSQAIGVCIMALLSQSRAAYRNSERRDDCNS
jgi:hypothetical protein